MGCRNSLQSVKIMKTLLKVLGRSISHHRLLYNFMPSTRGDQ